MTDKSVFEFNNYKAFLESVFNLPSNHGIRSRFARAIECQSSFVSQLISGKAELTLDQAYRATTFFSFSPDESDFFLLLVQLNRAADNAYRTHLLSKIKKIQEDRDQLKNRVKTTRTLEGEARAEYYSSWLYTAVHMAASLKPNKSPQQIAEYLKVPLETINQVLQFLVEVGLVIFEKGVVSMGQTHIHLPAGTPLVRTHHMNWRHQANQSLDRNDSKDLHYSVVYSLSRKDAELIRRKIADLIQENLKIIGPSEEEVLFANTIDFFEVGK